MMGEILETPLTEAEVRLLCEERRTYIQELLAANAALRKRVDDFMAEAGRWENKEDQWAIKVNALRKRVKRLEKGVKAMMEGNPECGLCKDGMTFGPSDRTDWWQLNHKVDCLFGQAFAAEEA